MRCIKLGLLLAMGVFLAACADQNITTRDAPFDVASLPFGAAPDADVLAVTAMPDLRVTGVAVNVPLSLKVSEANRYLPSGDIVWRGDPIGDRHAQVKAIFLSAMDKGTAAMDGATPVVLQIEVTRFHALSEKARYTTGGVHNINFNLTVRNADTGEIVGKPRRIRADLDGFGGQQALQAEALGQTQKVRITDHLAEVIRQELTTADGFKNPELGIIQAMNQL